MRCKPLRCKPLRSKVPQWSALLTVALPYLLADVLGVGYPPPGVLGWANGRSIPSRTGGLGSGGRGGARLKIAGVVVGQWGANYAHSPNTRYSASQVTNCSTTVCFFISLLASSFVLGFSQICLTHSYLLKWACARIPPNSGDSSRNPASVWNEMLKIELSM